MKLHPLTNFEIQKYYENELRFNSVYSRDNLPKNKGWCLCNKSAWIWRYWHTLDCFILQKNKIVCFDSFAVEHISEEIKESLIIEKLTFFEYKQITQ